MPELREYTATKRQSAREYSAEVRFGELTVSGGDYTPPANDAVNFSESSSYSPPSNDAVNFNEPAETASRDTIPREYPATYRQDVREYTGTIRD